MSKEQHVRECGECLLQHLSTLPETHLEAIRARLLRAAAVIAERAIRGHALRCGLPDVETWASRWLDGMDRSEAAAKHTQLTLRVASQRLRNQDRAFEAMSLEAAAYAAVAAEAVAVSVTSSTAVEVVRCLRSLSWAGWAAVYVTVRAGAARKDRDTAGHTAKTAELQLQADDIGAELVGVPLVLHG